MINSPWQFWHIVDTEPAECILFSLLIVIHYQHNTFSRSRNSVTLKQFNHVVIGDNKHQKYEKAKADSIRRVGNSGIDARTFYFFN